MDTQETMTALLAGERIQTTSLLRNDQEYFRLNEGVLVNNEGELSTIAIGADCTWQIYERPNNLVGGFEALSIARRGGVVECEFERRIIVLGSDSTGILDIGVVESLFARKWRVLKSPKVHLGCTTSPYRRP